MTRKLTFVLLLFVLFVQIVSSKRLRTRRLPLRKSVRDPRCEQFQTFTQNVDHFGFSNLDTYEQRYIMNVDHWKTGGPIFFYAGNEG